MFSESPLNNAELKLVQLIKVSELGWSDDGGNIIILSYKSSGSGIIRLYCGVSVNVLYIRQYPVGIYFAYESVSLCNVQHVR